MSADAQPAAGEPPRALGPGRKLVFGLGDHTVNASLSALSLLFFFFLTEVAGLRPGYASLVVLLGRFFDAASDPLLGRFSDTRTWKLGRRRPFFLIGMVPFACFFALIWQTPFTSQGEMFAYYTSIYVGLSLFTTVLSVPYLALMPEMATDYHERTSLNAYRSALAVAGTVVAAGMRFVVDGWGGGAAEYGRAGILLGAWLLVPWLAVYAVTFERRERVPRQHAPLMDGVRSIAGHKSYLRLCGLFIAARIAVDMSAATLPYFFAYWLLRSADFVPTILTLLGASVLSLPIWLRVGRHLDKHRQFAIGAAWWAALLVLMFAAQPDWPRPMLFALIALSGIGYCAADLMPWAMIGEVIDEDELATGQRREGLYNGFFTFMRKIAGASGQAMIGVVLELSGYVQRAPGAAEAVAQPESALLAIRIITALAPAFFLCVAIAFAIGYPLTRARHDEIRAALDERIANAES